MNSNQLEMQQSIQNLKKNKLSQQEDISIKRISKMKKFTQDDDTILLELVRNQGPKFHKFLKYFPYKNLNSLKNRYYKKLRYLEEEQNIQKTQESQLQANELNNSIKQQFSKEISSLMENVVKNLANLTQFC